MRSIREWFFPEYAHFGDYFDRRDIWASYRRRLNARWWAAISIAFVLVNSFVIDLLSPHSSNDGWTHAIIAEAIIVTGAGLAFNFWIRKPYRRFLREQLNRRGFSLCLQCGYDLRGQTTPRCPECGSPFDESQIRATIPSGEE